MEEALFCTLSSNSTMQTQCVEIVSLVAMPRGQAICADCLCVLLKGAAINTPCKRQSSLNSTKEELCPEPPLLLVSCCIP